MVECKVPVFTLFRQDPEFSNGRITSFNIKIQGQRNKVGNGSAEWESIPVNKSDADTLSGQRMMTVLKSIHLSQTKSVKLHVNAINSVGKSPEAILGIPEKSHGRCSW